MIDKVIWGIRRGIVSVIACCASFRPKPAKQLWSGAKAACKSDWRFGGGIDKGGGNEGLSFV